MGRCRLHCATNAPRKVAGFTTLELMVAIAIVAVLAAVAAPGMIDLVRNNRVSSVAKQLDEDLALARSEAIKRNARVLVCPVGRTKGQCGSGTSAWAQGWLVCHDANLDGKCDESASGDPNPIRQHGAIDSTLTVTGPATAAVFNANGSQGATATSSLTFTTRGTWTGAKSYVETVTPSGNISLVQGG
jgi:type IV fimbrial biogenesis protein FimT